jgi:hypothetical protein
MTMIASNAIPPYRRLAWSVTDGREFWRSYTALVEKSDRKRSTASLSLLDCQRVSAPTARVTVNSRSKIVDRFCISQDSLTLSSKRYTKVSKYPIW